ncbi:MAG: NAD(P)-dependent oxidoreductase [Saprospiraceae bacterium]
MATRRYRKVIFIDEPHPFLSKRLPELGFDCRFMYDADRQAILESLADCFGIIVRSRIRIDRELLEGAKELAFVARLGVGVEHIDMEYAAARGIEVLTSPEGSRDTVAEHALGMLLMLMNHLGRADRQVRKGEWIRAGNRAMELKGKTVGILGYGNMGMAFARRLQGFEVRTIAYDKFKTGYGDAFAEAVDLQVLQRESDVLSMHIPYTPENHYFVNADFLAAFAKPIFLVNTARGTVLDTAALVGAMERGQVIGAALDVIEYEELSFESLKPLELPAPFQYLLRSDRTVLTPHIAGWSLESNKGHARTLAAKIAAFCGIPAADGSEGTDFSTFTKDRI